MTQFDWAMGIGSNLIELDSIKFALDWLDAVLLDHRSYSNWSQGCKSNFELNEIQFNFLYILIGQTLLDNRLDWIKPYYQIASLISIKKQFLDQ